MFNYILYRNKKNIMQSVILYRQTNQSPLAFCNSNKNITYCPHFPRHLDDKFFALLQI